MDFDKYQFQTCATALPTAQRLEYLIPGLAAEAGEVAGKYAKYVRDEQAYRVMRDGVYSELGDVLWFVAQICEVLDFDMSMVAEANISKLQDRKERNVISGSGDAR